MEITIHINEQSVSIQVSVEVYDYLDQSDHKDENLLHEQRRHWDRRELDDAILAHECSNSYYETPEQLLCRKETLEEIRTALMQCSALQRERFCMNALGGMSYQQIAHVYGCSKVAVWHSIGQVRKKCRKILRHVP